MFKEEEKCGYHAEGGCYAAGYGGDDSCRSDIREAIYLAGKERWQKRRIYARWALMLVANEQPRRVGRTSLLLGLLLKAPVKFSVIVKSALVGMRTFVA